MSRTTLSLDDDVLDAARAIAARDDRTIGEVVSDLARQSLSRRRPKRNRLGLPLLPSSGERRKVTLAMVNRLRDELP
jgi:hypothetical protein